MSHQINLGRLGNVDVLFTPDHFGSMLELSYPDGHLLVSLDNGIEEIELFARFLTTRRKKFKKYGNFNIEKTEDGLAVSFDSSDEGWGGILHIHCNQEQMDVIAGCIQKQLASFRAIIRASEAKHVREAAENDVRFAQERLADAQRRLDTVVEEP